MVLYDPQQDDQEVPQEEGRCMETRPQGAKAFDSVATIRLSIEKANEWTKDITNLDVWNVFDTVPHKLVRKYIMEKSGRSWMGK